jgi:hypothetical protein
MGVADCCDTLHPVRAGIPDSRLFFCINVGRAASRPGSTRCARRAASRLSPSGDDPSRFQHPPRAAQLAKARPENFGWPKIFDTPHRSSRLNSDRQKVAVLKKFFWVEKISERPFWGPSGIWGERGAGGTIPRRDGTTFLPMRWLLTTTEVERHERNLEATSGSHVPSGALGRSPATTRRAFARWCSFRTGRRGWLSTDRRILDATCRGRLDRARYSAAAPTAPGLDGTAGS